MAFKSVSLRRDYLARDILFQFFSDKGVLMQCCDGCIRVPYKGLSFFEDNLIKYSIDLADSFLARLNVTGASMKDKDETNQIGSSSPIVLDAELDDTDYKVGKWDV